MNELQPVRFYMLVLSIFLLAMVAGTLYFLMGMGQSTYLLSDGVRVTTRFLDKPRYDMNLQGLIFSLSFLIAGALLLLMILLPDERRAPRSVGEAPPQPRRGGQGGAAAGAQTGAAQTAAAQPTAQPGAQTAAQTAAQPAAAAQADPAAVAQTAAQTAAGQQSSPLSIEGGEGDPADPTLQTAQAVDEPAPPPPPPAPSGVSVEEEVLQSATSADDLPMVDFGDNRFADTGDEDVVYGDGRITEDAMWEFVQQYPDSAVKFLYRKTLDNKPLSPTEEDIYRNWEARGMTRARVREIVLEIMRWQSLPDNFPHEIWRELRDQIYEISATAR